MKMYNLVKRVLEEKPQSRTSNKHLIWSVMTYLAGKPRASFVDVRDFLNCPPFETITRECRKVKADHPELRSPNKIWLDKVKKEESKGIVAHHATL